MGSEGRWVLGCLYLVRTQCDRRDWLGLGSAESPLGVGIKDPRSPHRHQQQHCHPLGSLLVRRTSGLIADLLNQSLHLNKICRRFKRTVELEMLLSYIWSRRKPSSPTTGNVGPMTGQTGTPKQKSPVISTRLVALSHGSTFNHLLRK